MSQSRNVPDARHDAIRDLLLERGSVRSSELAQRFGVSVMTIHRDLDGLAQQGWLRRIRGGATVERSALFELNVRARMQENAEAKTAIAASAIELISRGDAIMLDDSTTTHAVAVRVEDIGPVTIITNFRKTVETVVGHRDADLIGLGGQYQPSYDSYLGDITVGALETLHADLAFISASAVTDGACFHQIPQSIAVKRAMMAAAEKSVLLLDHSKFSKRALHRFTSIGDFDTVIVDGAVAAEDLAQLREQVDEVIVAGHS